jgi:prepilin-type N-terminal cleavage/methylation domain-containing protein
MDKRAMQRGFTLIEVLVALVVFAISVVGLVAMESRSLGAQRAANEIREAERVAQDAMAELSSRGFLELLQFDFSGAAVVSLPYDDSAVPAEDRLADYRRAPADIDPQSSEANVPGSVRSVYAVFRRVDVVSDASAVPAVSNPPLLPADLPNVFGLELEVTVLWIDRSNPLYQPPADATPESLTLDMIDTESGNYQPWVRSVQLRTVRINDVIMES